MRIGVPSEIKVHEYRVGLTPASVREFVRGGHQVVVQAGAGAGVGLEDGDYLDAGAAIGTVEDAFAVDLVIKVKEPQPAEWSRLGETQILFTYLHLASDRAQTLGLLASGVTAVAYETITDDRGGLPLLSPMSEVAGRLSIQAAACALEKHSGGEGLLIGGVPGVPPARVVVVGGGVVGRHAAKMAVGLGAEVTMLDKSLNRLRELDDLFGGRVRTRYSTEGALAEEVGQADVLIGAVLVPGASAPKLITRALLRRMKPGSVLVDVAIDQGGCAETSRPTTHARPTYTEEGVVHYCVANMPGAVPRTSTFALNNATLPIGLRLADEGLAAFQDPHIAAGLNIHRGKLTNRPVAESLGLAWRPYPAA
jgi:alanine dehydrogenase